MIIKVSTDTWRDVFDFFHLTDRKHLALISELGDRVFSDICQKWLHEWTHNVRLGPLLISPPPAGSKRIRVRGRWEKAFLEPACLQRLGETWAVMQKVLKVYFPFAEEQAPENIRDFKHIQIRHLDNTALQFLRRMQSLFHDLNLYMDCHEEELEATRIVIGHLFPLITIGGIESLYLNNIQLLIPIRDRFPTQFLSIKRIGVRIPKEDDASIDQLTNLLLPWLSTRRADGQPRMLIMQYFSENALELVDRIRQSFLDATSTSSFLIWLIRRGGTPPFDAIIPESTAQNVRTGEQLVIRAPCLNVHLIGRCPAELDGEKWVEEMDMQIYEVTEQTRRRITISHPSLGPFEEL